MLQRKFLLFDNHWNITYYLLIAKEEDYGCTGIFF